MPSRHSTEKVCKKEKKCKHITEKVCKKEKKCHVEHKEKFTTKKENECNIKYNELCRHHDVLVPEEREPVIQVTHRAYPKW